MKATDTYQKSPNLLSGRLCAILLIPALLAMLGYGVYHISTASFVTLASSPMEEAQMSVPSREASQDGMGALMKEAALNPGDATKQLEVAKALIDEGRLEIAEKFAQKAIHIDAKNPHAPYMLGYIYYQQGKAKEAVELMEQSIALLDRPEVRLSAGAISFYNLKDKERARAHLQKGLATPNLSKETKEALEEELKKVDTGQ